MVFKNVTPRSPSLPIPPRLPRALEPVKPDEVCSETRLERVAITDVSLSELGCEKAVVRESLLARVRFDAAMSTALELKDGRLIACDLSNVTWESPTLIRTELRECRLTGTTIAEGYFQNVGFTGCRMHLAHLRFSIFRRVRFENCILNGADFQGSDLTCGVFRNCDLQGAQFSQAKLRGTDFRGSQLAGIQAGVKDIAGALFDPLQALDLVRLLGVDIASLDEGD